MKKLKLNLDDLQVESFDTTPKQPTSPKGTVYGYYTYDDDTCFGPSCNWCPSVNICPTNNTCPGQNTCNNTCANTCPNTCANTCPNTCAYTCQGATCDGGFTCGGATCDASCLGPSCWDSCPIGCPILP